MDYLPRLASQTGMLPGRARPAASLLLEEVSGLAHVLILMREDDKDQLP